MKKLTKKAVIAVSAVMWVRGICTKHTGKMKGMTSISTSTLENSFCAEMAEIEGTICSHCYARQQLEYQKTTREKYADSTLDLTSRLLSWEEIPTVSNQLGCIRLESFGELNNTIQVMNYFSICQKNPEMNFALWTKRPELIAEVLSLGFSKPENLNIIWSTLLINGTPQIGRYDFVDGYFTVYTKEYAEEHNIKINCGGALCAECLECYDAHDGIFIVSELLK